MENPFAYGKEVSGDNFCNRKEEIKELSRDVNNSQNVIIFSQRRFGKTSLIKEVLRRCKDKGIIVVYVDLYSVLTEEDFVHLYASAVAETILGKIKRRLRDAAIFFKRIKPAFSIDQTGQLSWSIDIKKEHVLLSLEDVLESVNRYVESKKRKGVVCFDEFQQIGQFKTDQLEKMMRSSFQKHKNISYIFMGSKRHLISDMFNNPHRPFYKSGKPFPLDKIGDIEISGFIKHKFQHTRINISDGLVNQIVKECELHPYYMQYLCHIIWEKTIDKKKVARSVLSECISLLLKRESSTYEATWDLLTVKQKQVLAALVRVLPDDKIFSSDFLQRYNLGSASTLQRTLRSLIKKDLIDKTGGVYTIIDVFFKKWISRLL